PRPLGPPYLLAGFVDYLSCNGLEIMHTHDFFQAVHVLSGRFSFDAEDHRIEIGPGESGIVPPGVTHRYQAVSRDICRTFMTNFQTPCPEQLGESAEVLDGERSKRLWVTKPEGELVNYALERLRAECSSPGHASTAITQALLNLYLGAIARSAQRRDRASANEERIRYALALIEREYGRPLTLDELADAAGLGVSRFSEVFRRHTGLSPMRYLMDYRIGVAKVLLTASSFAIGAIAEHLGFGTVQHFSRTFHAHTGLSPTVYRANPPVEL
ncbi:MAG: AraC family transcriptional regulator, partial [Lentisphaeria bacterium]|nr:AraC family transcriptional regulator [Lentisphaeria bacterium]